MRYPYYHERRGSAIRFLPLVPITIHGPTASAEVNALVDSGAEDNVFRTDLARGLGLHLDRRDQVTLAGYDGTEGVAYRSVIELQVGPHRWRATALFSDVLTRRALLGQDGFFAFFTVTFRYRDRILDVRPVKA